MHKTHSVANLMTSLITYAGWVHRRTTDSIKTRQRQNHHAFYLQDDLLRTLFHHPIRFVNEKSETQNPTATNTDGDPEPIGNESVVASDDMPEGSLIQPPSPKRSEEEDLREGRDRARNADTEKTQTHQRSNRNFNINADTRPRCNGGNDTQGYQEGLEYGILPGLSSLPPRGDGKANDTPDVDQHMLERRKADKSMARVDSCSRLRTVKTAGSLAH